MHPTSQIQGQRLGRRICNMDKVYGNAYCNLSATSTTSTTSPSTGLSLSTPTEIYQPVTVSLNFSGKNGVDYKGNFTVIDSDIWATNITRSPLMKRAWVFQERMLAPRVLHFTRLSSFRNIACCRPAKTIRWVFLHFPKRNLTVNFAHDEGSSLGETEPLEHAAGHYQRHHDLWSSIVEDYSRYSLTREDYKLGPLTGVAQRISGLQKHS
jgi:Heterokaryon incompatibility protein (HET)